MFGQACDRRGRRHLPQRPHQLADMAPELERPSGGVRFPERHLARLAGRRRHQYLSCVIFPRCAMTRRRAGTSPRRGSRRPSPRRALRQRAAGPRSPAREDAVKTPIGNGAAVDHGDPPGSLARGDLVLQSIPRQPRPQIREVVRGIPARRACRAHRRRSIGSTRRTAPRCGPPGRAHPRSRIPSRPSRPSAGRARPADCADSGSPRSVLRASRRVTAAHATRSPRYLGTMMPRLA